LQQQALQQEMTPPQAEKLIEPMSLTTLDTQGSITKEVLFAEQNVHHWTLSNGDKVIWLKLPQAKNKTYFRAQSSAGFKAQD
ncbi:MAG TPA: hypothetical protein DD638_03760, partial [Pasteurellaceae bacterium]|nr:hypothetical protein [Pasteurellaceae bacterium]